MLIRASVVLEKPPNPLVLQTPVTSPPPIKPVMEIEVFAQIVSSNPASINGDELNSDR